MTTTVENLNTLIADLEARVNIARKAYNKSKSKANKEAYENLQMELAEAQKELDEQTATLPEGDKPNLSSYLPHGLHGTAPEPSLGSGDEAHEEMQKDFDNANAALPKSFEALGESMVSMGADPDAIEDLRRQLEAARAELHGLKSNRQAKTMTLSPKAAKRREWQEQVEAENMDSPETLLGKAQRMEREHLLVSTFKAVRALRWSQLPEVFVYLVTQAAQNGGVDGEATVDDLFEQFTTKQAPKGGKKKDN